jgi:hypothetical protein
MWCIGMSGYRSNLWSTIKIFVVGALSLCLFGCGGKISYRAISGFQPELPLQIAEARCEAIAQDESATNIQRAVQDAKGSSYTTTTQGSCFDHGYTISCNASSYTRDSSGVAQVGAAFGAALANAMARKERMSTCMNAMGYESYTVDAVKSTAIQSAENGMEAYDDAAALRELTLLAKQGDADAQNNLGYMYDLGEGVPQDYKAAFKWYTLAVEQGHAAAQYNLGYMYDLGEGVPQDYKAAVKWYRLAAKQGYANAQNNLGYMYDEGTGVPQDDKAAFKWYKAAAEQGNAAAQNNLGYMYKYGEGVPQGNVYAHMWYSISASSGETEALEARDRTAQRMTSSQIEKAQALARECVRKNYKGC